MDNAEMKRLWVVIDEDGEPCHSASWPQACHEHINDAINDHGLMEAAQWKVREYVPAPALEASAKRIAELVEQFNDACLMRDHYQTLWLDAGKRIAELVATVEKLAEAGKRLEERNERHIAEKHDLLAEIHASKTNAEYSPVPSSQEAQHSRRRNLPAPISAMRSGWTF